MRDSQMPQTTKSLSEIRAQVCDTTMVWLALLAIPAFSINIYRGLEVGWRPVIGVYAAVTVTVLLCAAFRLRLPYRLKANVIVGLLFLNACGALISFGSPAGLQHFVGSAVMAAVLFGRRAGIIAVALALATILATFWSFRLGILNPAGLGRITLSGASWLSNAGGVVITAIGPIIAISTLVTQLNAERSRAETANRAKSNFLATISHELRTPMTGILGLSDPMMGGAAAADMADRLSRINKAGKWLLGMLDNLLDFSKIEQNGVNIERIPFSLSEILEEAQELCAPLAVKKGLRLDILGPANGPDAFLGDPTRLRQVILNLVGNAIKFTEIGAVSVRVGVTVTGQHEALLSVEVQDTGIGIAPDQLETLFQPFVQGDATIARRFGGTGLGLAISQRLVTLMGGRISASSTPEVGSRFAFEIPLQEGAAVSSALRGRAHDGLDALKPTKPRRILLADDNETIRHLVELALTHRGHVVETVSNGYLALQAVQARSFDIVLMDIHMPVMNGIEAAQAIRAVDVGNDLVIVALTADVTAEQHSLFSKPGFNRVITKPIDWNALLALLEEEPVVSTAEDRLPKAAAANDDTGTDGAPLIDEELLFSLKAGLPHGSWISLLTALDANVRQLQIDLANALASGNLPQARRVAHTLKGVLSQFGAVRAARIAQDIETKDLTLQQNTALAEALAAVLRDTHALLNNHRDRLTQMPRNG